MYYYHANSNRTIPLCQLRRPAISISYSYDLLGHKTSLSNIDMGNLAAEKDGFRQLALWLVFVWGFWGVEIASDGVCIWRDFLCVGIVVLGQCRRQIVQRSGTDTPEVYGSTNPAPDDNLIGRDFLIICLLLAYPRTTGKRSVSSHVVMPPIMILTGRPKPLRRSAALSAPLQPGPVQ